MKAALAALLLVATPLLAEECPERSQLATLDVEESFSWWVANRSEAEIQAGGRRVLASGHLDLTLAGADFLAGLVELSTSVEGSSLDQLTDALRSRSPEPTSAPGVAAEIEANLAQIEAISHGPELTTVPLVFLEAAALDPTIGSDPDLLLERLLGWTGTTTFESDPEKSERRELFGAIVRSLYDPMFPALEDWTSQAEAVRAAAAWLGEQLRPATELSGLRRRLGEMKRQLSDELTAIEEWQTWRAGLDKPCPVQPPVQSIGPEIDMIALESPLPPVTPSLARALPQPAAGNTPSCDTAITTSQRDIEALESGRMPSFDGERLSRIEQSLDLLGSTLDERAPRLELDLSTIRDVCQRAEIEWSAARLLLVEAERQESELDRLEQRVTGITLKTCSTRDAGLALQQAESLERETPIARSLATEIIAKIELFDVLAPPTRMDLESLDSSASELDLRLMEVEGESGRSIEVHERIKGRIEHAQERLRPARKSA